MESVENGFDRISKLSGFKVERLDEDIFEQKIDDLVRQDTREYRTDVSILGAGDCGNIPGTATSDWLDKNSKKKYTPVAYTCYAGIAVDKKGRIKIFHHKSNEVELGISSIGEGVVAGFYGSKSDSLEQPQAAEYQKIGLTQIGENDPDIGFSVLFDPTSRKFIIRSFHPVRLFESPWCFKLII
jgi:hypothetical protein